MDALLGRGRCVDEVKFTAGAVNYGSIGDFMSALAESFRAWRRFWFAQVKLEGRLVHIDALIVAELCDCLCICLHILRHSELRAWARHAEFGNCESRGADGKPNCCSCYSGQAGSCERHTDFSPSWLCAAPFGLFFCRREYALVLRPVRRNGLDHPRISEVTAMGFAPCHSVSGARGFAHENPKHQGCYEKVTIRS